MIAWIKKYWWAPVAPLALLWVGFWWVMRAAENPAARLDADRLMVEEQERLRLLAVEKGKELSLEIEDRRHEDAIEEISDESAIKAADLSVDDTGRTNWLNGLTDDGDG